LSKSGHRKKTIGTKKRETGEEEENFGALLMSANTGGTHVGRVERTGVGGEIREWELDVNTKQSWTDKKNASKL